MNKIYNEVGKFTVNTVLIAGAVYLVGAGITYILMKRSKLTRTANDPSFLAMSLKWPSLVCGVFKGIRDFKI